MSLWLLWLAAPFIGLLLGLFGAGGGMLAVPLLIYAAGLPVKEAVAMSLFIVAGVSLVAAVQQRAWRVVKPLLLASLFAGGLLGAWGGAWLGMRIADDLQQLLFGILLVAVAAWSTRLRVADNPMGTPTCRCGWAFVAGIALGLLTGVLGVGSGFLMVPTLLALGIAHMPTAVAHSLVLIAANASVAGMFYLGAVPMEPQLTLGVGLVAAVGSIVGSLLLKRLPGARLRRSFSLGLGVLGTAMLVHLAW